MIDLETWYYPLKLKFVDRASLVGGRKESSAEHSWGCMVLAKEFLSDYPDLDAYRVMQLLLFHDVVEIETGDVDAIDSDRKEKHEAELQAIPVVQKHLHPVIQDLYKECALEYEEQQTPEAKFAKAIDVLEPMIQCIHILDKWKEKGYTVEKMQVMKMPYLEAYPKMLAIFNDIMTLFDKPTYMPLQQICVEFPTIAGLKYALRLKESYRECFTGSRLESSAEHTWSCMLLALTLDPGNVNMERIVDLLLFHDVIELESGDISIFDPDRESLEKEEIDYLPTVKKQLTPQLGKIFTDTFTEMHEQKTREAQFACAIDKLEPEIYVHEEMAFWVEQGYDLDMLEHVKKPLIKPFPSALEVLEQVISYGKESGYL